MQRGFTLIEILLALAIAACLLSAAIPLVNRTHDQILVTYVTDGVVRELAQARLLAIRDSRVMQLRLAPDSLRLEAVIGGVATPYASTAGPLASAVTLTGPAYPVQYAPTGIALGFSNGTWTLSRGAATRRVVVSRYGRVQVR